MNYHNKVLLDSIEREKAKLDYFYSENDRRILDKMFDDINSVLHTNIHYLAEVDAFDIVGAGSIMIKYIYDFESESIRAYLIPQIVSDKVDNVEELIVDLYKKFRASSEYISTANKPAPAHIYTRYDTAISRLKPKKIKIALMDIIHTPRDVYYLPLTVRMLASWKMAQLKDLLLYCVRDGGITHEDVALANDSENYYPSFDVINRQLKLIAISNLKYYPSREILKFLLNFSVGDDSDLNACVEKSISYMRKTVDISSS